MGSYHVGLTYFVLGDSSVLGITDDVDLAVYQAMVTVAGSEIETVLD